MVVDALRRRLQGDDDTSGEAACDELIRLLSPNNVDNKARCGAAGGVEVIVDMLTRRGAAEALVVVVVEKACTVLDLLTNASADNAARWRAANGADVVCPIQERHENYPRICALCESILGRL